MRYVTIFLLVALLTGCSKKKDTAFVATDDCVVLLNDIAMDYDVEVGLSREADGRIKVEAYRLEYSRDSAGKWQFSPRLLSAGTIRESEYQQIVRLVESAEMKAIAAAYPPPSLDGWTWKIRRVSGKNEVAYAFFCPEWRPEVPGIAHLLDLGRRVARAAHLAPHDLSPGLGEEKPNQSPEPTSGLAPGRGSP